MATPELAASLPQEDLVEWGPQPPHLELVEPLPEVVFEESDFTKLGLRTLGDIIDAGRRARLEQANQQDS